jgi:hypothetical protein
VTGLQLSPVLQHLAYCGEGADSSEFFVWGAEAPPPLLRTFDTDRQLWDWRGVGAGVRGPVTSFSLDCGSGLRGSSCVSILGQTFIVYS